MRWAYSGQPETPRSRYSHSGLKGTLRCSGVPESYAQLGYLCPGSARQPPLASANCPCDAARSSASMKIGSCQGSCEVPWSRSSLNPVTVQFRGRVRRWREDKPGGLAVVDVPDALVAELGGRRQMRVTGTLNGSPFTGSTMLVAGGGLCVGVSRVALKTAGASMDELVTLTIKSESPNAR
jgi:Domain of unknown function (DUF1905)